ncbi:MAG: succinate dehydrogenase assembly factor 2 [Pseudomonadota bacterium]|nr:succinate dehydrogenase assembly factor 2 [Pseudomonadota bacterium]
MADHRARMRWRCRRGMKELDHLLLEFLERHLDELSPPEQSAFESLLELQDPELVGYLLGAEQPTDPVMADVVRRIRGDA